jgi:thymidylate synthase (FAD)
MESAMSVESSCVLSVELIRSYAFDNTVVEAARISTGTEVGRELDQGGEALIGFLMRNRHGTPFEHNSMTFRIHAPIVVWREFMRHRIGFSYNEESGRYKKLAPVFYVPGVNRLLIQVGKAGAYTFERGTAEQYEKGIAAQVPLFEHAWSTYVYLLDLGWAKELARMVLPVALYSTAYVTCNARSLMSFLSLRTADENSSYPSYPMYEIEQVALQMEGYWRNLMPVTQEAFNKHGRVSP